MDRARIDPLRAQRNVILSLLLALAVAAWAVLVWNGAADMGMQARRTGMTAPMFLAMWIVMMVGMMFPAAAPVILSFHKVQSAKRHRGEAFVSTWLFVSAYLFVWTLAGVAAYAGAVAAGAIAVGIALPAAATARLGGAMLVAAGLYQLTPLKDLCLSRCRSPLAFFMTSWRDGPVGALRMGLLHGAYCLGCCWLLFVILFPLGIMNLAAMAVITVVVFAEKTMPRARATARAAAVALIAYGAAIGLAPQILPTFAATAPMGMPADMHPNPHAFRNRPGLMRGSPRVPCAGRRRGGYASSWSWRRGGDSNSRASCEAAGFQDRCNQPLCHLSGGRELGAADATKIAAGGPAPLP